MRLIVQRVASAAVSWTDGSQGSQHRKIGRGLVILAGAGPDDTRTKADRLADRLAVLRIFPDEEGRTNRSVQDVGGEALVVSQFTLYADFSRGRRPSFVRAGDPALAGELVDRLADRLREQGIGTRTGSFGAEMMVSLDNDGPFTFALSTDPWETRIGG